MAENSDDFKNWTIPDLGNIDAENIDNSLLGKPASWYNKQDEKGDEACTDAGDDAATELAEDEEEVPPAPLTLDDIEAIRQSAYEDGFNEGREAGHRQGLEEGKLEGLASGHQEGLTQGLAEGLAEGAEQIALQQATWESLLERLHNPLAKLDENAEYQLVRLATSLAEQIARSEVNTSPQIILQALKQGVAALPISEQTLTINLHPDDLSFVQAAYSQQQCIQRGWNLQAEPTLMRGDCQIHTQVSSIDYTFDTRIEQVLKSFFKDNHQQLPAKNDTSDLSNEQPFTAPRGSDADNVDSGSSNSDGSNLDDSVAAESTPDAQRSAPDSEAPNSGAVTDQEPANG